jgi:all-beta uncharacterized protein
MYGVSGCHGRRVPDGQQDGIMRKDGIWVLAAFMVTAPLTSRAAAAATIMVSVGDNLQGAIDNANPGDVILLHAGVTFTGNFVIRSGKSSITLRSSADDSLLPAAGQRTSPDYWQYLPKLQSTSTVPALRIEPGASHITLMHLEILASGNGSANLIELGAVNSGQTSITQAPHHLILDRLLVNIPASAPQRRAIALNSADTQILGCYLAGLKYAGADAQAIAGWNGPGPFLIENNYLEGAGENLLFGGSDPTISGLVPTNIQIRRNHFAKPLAWKGSSWTVKNLLELKNAQDVVIEGNLFEYNWLAAQTGYAVLFTPRNQYGGNPSTVVQRVRFVNNWVRHVSSVFSIMGRDNEHPSQLTNDIEIRNNVFEDVSKSTYGGDGRLLLIDGGDNIRLRNNTSFNTGTAIYVWGHVVTNFEMENNIVNYGSYGIMGANCSAGNATIAAWFPGAVILGNVMAGTLQSWNFPAGNSYPADWAAVGFVDLAAGNYRLAPTSPYVAAGTNGTTPGANIDAIVAAVGGAMSVSAQTAPCTFTVTPSTHTSPAPGDTFAVTVAASAASCAWTATSNASWATPSVAGGTGSATVSVTVSPNSATAQRTANLSVAGRAISLTQDAAVPALCTFALSQSSITASAAGTSAVVTLTASGTTCPWTAAANASWLSLSAASGRGSAPLTLTVAPNTAKGNREGSAMIAGLTLTVRQYGIRRKSSTTSGGRPAASGSDSGRLTASPKTARAGRDVTVGGATLAVQQLEFQRKTSTTSGGRSAASGNGTGTLTVPPGPHAVETGGDATISRLTLAIQQLGFRKKTSARSRRSASPRSRSGTKTVPLAPNGTRTSGDGIPIKSSTTPGGRPTEVRR